MSNLIPRKIKRYGWKRDLPHRDDPLYAARIRAGQIPASFNLLNFCPPVYDQQQEGSCTANSLAGNVQLAQIRKLAPGGTPAVIAAAIAQSWIPSRNFIYYNERVIEGDPTVDGGAQIRDGVKSLMALGVCPESLWPYNEVAFASKPGPDCYTAALDHKVSSASRVAQNAGQIRAALAEGLPISFGFSVYESFESDEVAQTGIVPMPESDEEMVGGHAVLAVGYDDPSQMFTVRNSWGAGWGQEGYFKMPYAYVLNPNLSSDFWVIPAVN